MTMKHRVGLDIEKDLGIFELWEDDKALAHILLDAPALDQLIFRLSQIRSAMRETVSPELDPGARIETIEEPAWRIPDKHSGDARKLMLILRHPGLGWLGFLLEKTRALAISAALKEWAEKLAD